MSELWFIGLGLGSEADLGERARGLLLRAGALLADAYTSELEPGSLERLARILGREIRPLARAELESAQPVREALAAHALVALLVPGDPFVATTHVALRVAVERAGHTWRYLPGASILTAAPSLLGLQHYRFGRVVSLPFPEPGFAPRSPIDRIEENRNAGLHSLVLLDLRPEEGRYLRAEAALDLLLERGAGRPWIGPALELGVVARVGAPDPAAWYGPIAALRAVDFGAPLHALIVPAPELHPAEAEAVAAFRVAPSGDRSDRR